MGDDPVERRELLKLAAAAAVLVGEQGCASPQHPAPPSAADIAAHLDPAAADALLAKIDGRMAWLDQASLPDEILPLSKLPRATEADAARTGALVRKAVRTLYLTGRFLDMPDEMKVHPGVQARLQAMQPEMDDAILGMTEHLERMTPEDHRRVQTHLRKDDLFAEHLARMLEKTASDDGLSFQRTFGVRSAALDLGQRMSAQSPALVIDPLVRKVRRIEAHPRTDAEQARVLAARIGEQAFWEHQQHVARLHEAWMIRLASADTQAATAPAAPPPSSPGKNTLNTGGIIMGFGAGSVALGLIFAGLASATSTSAFIIPALVLGVTIGPILLVVGLIVVIVGAIMRASE
jgi:hypothetical protein